MGLISRVSSRTYRKYMSDLPKNYFESWGQDDLVCLDVDSTVCVDESINEFAKFLGKYEEINQLTSDAMNGTMSFESSFSKRLKILSPTIDQFQEFLKNREVLLCRKKLLSNGVNNFVDELRRKGVWVCLISGGFQEIIELVAKHLGLPVVSSQEVSLCGGIKTPPVVVSNRLLFYSDKTFAGHDTNRPVSRAFGKADAIENMQKKFGFKKIAMIGDGKTDLEVKEKLPNVKFICFTEHVNRTDVI